jgi:lysophospholipid acyltransferase (LPLAT)-like uncharacterized protein
MKSIKIFLKKIGTPIAARLIKYAMQFLIWTCRQQVEGLDHFMYIAKHEKCILMLWHNRLAAIPAILNRYTPNFQYAALISASRDGELLDSIVKAYQHGHTVRVPHHSRSKALRELIEVINKGKWISIVTPDGPRGPKYQLKPGIALAALETGASVFALNWEASNFWQLKSWDNLRIPKPFSSIKISFGPSIHFKQIAKPSLEEVMSILTQQLPFT